MEEITNIKISELCSKVCSGGTPKSSVPSYYDGNIPWLNTKEINFNRIYSTEKSITEDGLNNSSAKWIDKNAVIVAMYGATAGKTAISKIPLTTNQACCNLMIDADKADYRFVYYALVSEYNQLASLANGGAQQNLNAQQIKDFEIPFFSLKDQKRIANILSTLDDKIELNRRINDNLEQQAQALFKSWFVDFEPFNGEKPSNWSYCKIKNLHHIIETGKRPKGGVAHIKQGIPSIGAESIKGIGYYDYSKTKYISNEFASSLKKGKIHDYDLLIYKDGGKPGYFIPNFSIMGEGFPFDTMYLNEHVFRLDLGSSGMNIFAYFYFQTDEIINMLESVGGKAAIPGINQQNIEDLEILSPDIDYVQRYGELVYPIFKSILQNCRENAKLEKIRDALLPRLMSGELKIYDLNC